MRFILGDCETAGLGASKKACEIALKEIDTEFNEIQRWYSLIDPEIPIEDGAYQIHGISNDRVASSPTSEEFIPHVLGGKLEGDLCLICHNVSFDKSMLNHIGNITHTICTLELARSLIRDSQNHQLQTLRQYFNIPEDKAHSAMGDVNVTHALLGHLVRLSGRSLLDHANTTVKTIHVMPFGKHKGWPLLKLPVAYIDYMLTLELDDNLKESLTKVRKLK